MTNRAKTARLVANIEYRDEASDILDEPGDAAVVVRGVPRSFMMKCPDGCGEMLAVNLDGRTDKAWRLDMRGGAPTLYPSVWKEAGCRSHFIVWRGYIVWCDRGDNLEPPYDPLLEDAVLRLLTNEYQNAAELAYAVDEIPWDVSRAARRLVKRGIAKEGRGKLLDSFRLSGARMTSDR
ncbi:DUF6527 family protein [Rhizobium leguminosarum]